MLLQYKPYKTMKELKFILYMMFAVLTLAACGGDDDDNDGNDGGNTTQETNLNKNIIKEGTDPAVTRLEFPRVKGGRNRILVYRTADKYGINYSVEWDADKKSQRWSCYQMYQGWQGNAGRYEGDPQYPYDPNLPASERWDEDYFWRSNFDHGHICPSADRQYSKEANKQTFYMTNMQPQYNKFNAKLWAVMEQKVRNWTPSTTGDTLYVCKGGTIDNEKDILTRIQGKLIAPRYFYMALLIKSRGQYRALAFFVEQKNEDRSKDDLKQYVMTIDQLEERTGIDFFCNLPDDIENKVESSYNLNAWGLNK